MQNFLKTLLMTFLALLICRSIFAGWMALGAFLLFSNTGSQSYRRRMVFYLFTILILAFINTTKPLDNSDLGYYYWLYNFAGKKSMLEYAAQISREPLYHIYTFVAYLLTGGNFRLFLLLTTALMYLPILAGAEKIMKTADLSGRNILAACLTLLTFSEYFSYTSHLMRQVLAGAAAFYIMTQIKTSRRTFWLALLPLCGLIHASAFLFCGYYLIHYMVKYRNTSPVSLVAGLLVMLVAAPLLVSGMFGDISTTLNYAARRLTAGSEETVTLGLLPLLVTGSLLPMALWSFHKYPQTEIRQFLGIPLLLLLFMAVNFSNQLFVLRFMEYCYMYLPFVLALFLQPYPLRRVMPLLALTMTVRFLLKLPTSDFSYISPAELANTNALSFALQFFN